MRISLSSFCEVFFFLVPDLYSYGKQVRSKWRCNRWNASSIEVGTQRTMINPNIFFSSLLQAEKLGFTDTDEYFMGYKKRGLAIVINNKDFHPNTSKAISLKRLASQCC